MNENERECVCGHPPDWPESENLHYKCDFCGQRPVARELVVHTLPWAICRRCWDFHHLAIEIIQKRHAGEEE